MAVVGAGRGGGDNINYLVKMITENEVFHFLLPASDRFLLLFPLVWQFLFLCLCVSLSPSLSLSYET